MRICVLLGGESKEREISIKSGQAIKEALLNNGHKVDAIDGTLSNIKNIKSSDYDLVFIALHGGFGEDGTVQSILEEKEIVYTGSGPNASRLALDKKLSKKIFIENNILTPEYFSLDNLNQINEIIEKIGFPLILKPCKEGSSIGLYLIQDKKELDKVLSEIDYSDYLIEKYIKGREFTAGILSDYNLPIIEILPESIYFDFESKYTKGKCKYNFLSEEEISLEKKIHDIAVQAFNVLGCKEYGRVDLMLDQNNNVYVLEVNTIPGFTKTSLLPKSSFKIGISFDKLCDVIISLAIKNKKK